MKTNFLRIAFMSMVACFAMAACTKEDANIARKATVVLSGDSYFSGNSASVNLTLSNPLDKDVTVVLASGTIVSDAKYALVDGKDLSLPSVTIPAGQTSANATVSVNPDKYSKGRYQAQVCIGSVTGATAAPSGDKLNIVLLNGVPRVNVITSDFSYDGEGSVKVSLDVPSENGGTVTIKVAADSDVPAEAITFEPTLKIEKDGTEASADVKVDITKLTEGGDLEVKFEVEKVDGDLEAGECEPGILEFVLPQKSEDWELSYFGPYGTGQAFMVGGADGVYYNLFTTAKDEIGEDNNLSVVLLEQRDWLAKYLANYDIDFLVNRLKWFKKGNGGWVLDNQDAGDYDIWMVEFDSEGEVTGKYLKTTYSIVVEEPEENYSRWLGDWTLGEGDDAMTLTITPGQVNKTFIIDGFEGLPTQKYQISLTAVYDAQTGGISLPSQLLGKWTDDDLGDVQDVFYGFIQVKGNPTVATGDYEVTKILMTGDGVASMTPGTLKQEGTSYSIVGMKYLILCSDGSFQAYTGSITSIPNTLTKVVEEEEEPAPEFELLPSFGTSKDSKHSFKGIGFPVGRLEF